MRIYMERNGTVFEYEHPPMKEGRFRLLCALGGVLALVRIVVQSCGVAGLIPLLFVAVVMAGLDKI